MKLGKIEKSFVLLLVILILAVTLYFYQAKQFNQNINTKFVEQQKSFPYYLKPGEGQYLLILGDLNGLNKNAYQNLLAFTQNSQNKHSSLIVIPSIMPKKSSSMPDLVYEEDFLEQISNEHGIVLADNFCTTDWPTLKEKLLYTNSTLSPGPFCLSEPAARDLNQIVKRFWIRKVILVYDAEHYQEFIANFLKYLEENDISYQFVRSENVQEIKEKL